MRYHVIAIIMICSVIMAASSLTVAQTITPPEKPVKPSGLLLRPTSKPNGDSDFSLKNSRYMVSASEKSDNMIVTPPSLPETKSRLLSVDEMGGIIRPVAKPLSVRVDTIERIRPAKNFEESVILRYTDNQDERTAGGLRAVPSRTNARGLPDQPRLQIRETTDDSPFETASLQKAKRNTAKQDPVIIFFKERSSELEVGQLNIMETDILRPLQQSASRTVSLYGYAEDHKTSHDLSLSRAILISEYLAEKGIAAERIEARSMGSKTPVSPKNRVDVYIMD